MKTLWVTALVGLSLVGVMESALAQRSGRDYGYDQREDDGRGEREDGSRRYDNDDRSRDRDREYDHDQGREPSRAYNDGQRRERGRSYDNDRGGERDRGYDDDRDRQRGRGYGDDDRGPERGRRYREQRESRFDEDEYLRCYPDVRRAVERGEMKSGEFHYRTFGRREGRRLTCPTKL